METNNIDCNAAPAWLATALSEHDGDPTESEDSTSEQDHPLGFV